MPDIFVYGTLKRGECREVCWPRDPLQICKAFVRGSLYELKAYPALIAGDDWVQGEVWTLANDDIDVTLRVLDDIEGYRVGGNYNLYERVEVDWFCNVEQSQAAGSAMTYHFARITGLQHLEPMKCPGGKAICWTNGPSSENSL